MAETIKKTYGGKVFFIDRDNINTDEIIPAKYLTYIDKEPLKPHLLEDLKVEGITPSEVNWEDYGVIVSRANFGSGSSREMAPWAFEINGINVILASNFARIFRENSFNVGMLAIELGPDMIEDIFKEFSLKENVNATISLTEKKIIFSAGDESAEFYFNLNKIQEDLIEAGGWVALAEQKY